MSPLNLRVIGTPGSSDASLELGQSRWPAKVGRAGILAPDVSPAEGDGATPTGRFHLRQVYYRPDRVRRPQTGLPLIPLRSDQLWCDDPHHSLYNRPVCGPFPARAEAMWMDRRSYDYCIVLDFNLVRPISGHGSAIFLHLTRQDETPPPTEGCIAVSPDLMVSLLPRLGIGSTLTVTHQ